MWLLIFFGGALYLAYHRVSLRAATVAVAVVLVLHPRTGAVTLSEDGRRVIGHGAHTDIIVASARAYVHALNKLEWHKRQRGADEPRGI